MIVWTCELTPEALANFSQGLERSDNPGTNVGREVSNAESVGKIDKFHNPFRVAASNELFLPRVVAALQPWAEIGQRLRRTSQRTLQQRRTSLFYPLLDVRLIRWLDSPH
jgi:hypothetical protein